MEYKKATEIHQIICEKFFFNRKEVEVFAEGFDDDPEPEELVFEIFSDVIGVSTVELSEGRYGIELLATIKNLYLSPIIDFFALELDEIFFSFSNDIELQARKRPLEIGCSIGPLNENRRGTLGCFVKDMDNDNVYVLSNHHVIYSELGHKDSFIIQPATTNGGGTNDAIGMYVRSLRPDDSGINEFDAAIAGPVALEFNNSIPELNVEVKDVIEPKIGMKVYKIGVTTGKTFGVITSVISSVKVKKTDDQFLEFENQICIEGRGENFIDAKNFSRPGDSGSVVFDYETNKVVGLHFSGNGIDKSFANVAQGVFQNLRIKLD